MEATPKEKKMENLVLCGFCKLPIHISEFGGVQKKIGFFHEKCFIIMETNGTPKPVNNL